MRKACFGLFLCAVTMLCLLAGCTKDHSKPNVELSKEQEAHIDLMVQHRNTWKEVKELFASYPVNRIHVAETSNGTAILTIAYVEDGTGSDKGWQSFVAHSFAAKDGVFTSVEGCHKDWIADCISVDLENLSDAELREVLQESYRKSLSKE